MTDCKECFNALHNKHKFCNECGKKTPETLLPYDEEALAIYELTYLKRRSNDIFEPIKEQELYRELMDRYCSYLSNSTSITDPIFFIDKLSKLLYEKKPHKCKGNGPEIFETNINQYIEKITSNVFIIIIIF